MDHVAFIRPRPLDALLSGEKEWEVRLSKRQTPIQQVSAGDRCLIKRSGHGVERAGRVAEAATFRNLAHEDIKALQRAFGSGLDFETEYWQKHAHANCVVLIQFGEFVPASLPDKYTPKGVQLGWVARFSHFEKAQLKSPNASASS